MNITRAPVKIVRSISVIDLILFLALVFIFYAFAGVAREWTGPFHSHTEIDLSLRALPQYAFFSLVRGFAAYTISLVFSVGYGYLAAHSRVAERILIAVLDILQSIPVLAFLPGVVLALVALFPHSNTGLEIASIFMIFNGQVWNMTFSFYSSVKGVPPELRDVSQVFRFNRWDTLKKIEMPFAMNGLLWNSMLSMAGGWFFLMVAESFTLGDKNFRLPGIGSYIAVAYEEQNQRAMAAGLVAMLFIIVVVDRLLWAPLVGWSERFRLETLLEESDSNFSWAAWTKRSVILRLFTFVSGWLQRRDKSTTAKMIQGRKALHRAVGFDPARALGVLKWVGLALILGVSILGAKNLVGILARTHTEMWLTYIRDTFFTMIRVAVAVVFGSLWAIPVGVWIGTHPQWTRRLQPIVQMTASFPYPMVFPLIATLLARFGVGVEMGAAVLMIFGSQWYILFNVISGATRIPHHLLDVAQVFRVRGIRYWTSIVLPGIFPDLVNGWITAAGGAWNACIVSEYVKNGPHTFIATGIGASITRAATDTDFPALAAAVVTMVTTVVLLNRVFWGSLYQLAETKYRLDSVNE